MDLFTAPKDPFSAPKSGPPPELFATRNVARNATHLSADADVQFFRRHKEKYISSVTHAAPRNSLSLSRSPFLHYTSSVAEKSTYRDFNSTKRPFFHQVSQNGMLLSQHPASPARGTKGLGDTSYMVSPLRLYAPKTTLLGDTDVDAELNAFQPDPSYRARLIGIYQRIAPHKIQHVDRILYTFQGQEEKLFDQLERPPKEPEPIVIPPPPVQPKPQPPIAPVIVPEPKKEEPPHHHAPPFLGLTLNETSAKVYEMWYDGPAYRAGIRPGDRIVRFSGVEVSNYEETLQQMKKTKVGEDSPITVLKPDGSTVEYNLKPLTSKPEFRNFPEIYYDTSKNYKIDIAAYERELHGSAASGMLADPQAYHRERLSKIYSIYAPEKLSKVDEVLAAYKGKEDVMISRIEAKYRKRHMQQ